MVDLAGISNDPACELDAELTRSVNFEGARRTHRLAHAAGVSRIVFASSCSVYGHGEGTQLVETSSLHPVSLYAQCKADGEKSMRRFLCSAGSKGKPVTTPPSASRKSSLLLTKKPT